MKRSWQRLLIKRKKHILFLILFVFLLVVVVPPIMVYMRKNIVPTRSPKPPMALSYEEVLRSYTAPPS